jgi:hypothetical protein
MELDDLKVAWARLEQRVEAAEARAARLDREVTLGRSRRTLLGMSWGQAVQVAIWIAVVAIAAPFWIEHRRVPHLLAAGLTLHLYGIATIWVSVVQLLLIGRTYYTAPVLVYQGRLAELSRFRAISTFLLGLPWCVLWIPATMVGARRWWGIDLYAASPGWIHISLAVGLAAMVATVWAVRYVPARVLTSPRLCRIADDLAGRTLTRAARLADDVAQFERES